MSQFITAGQLNTQLSQATMPTIGGIGSTMPGTMDYSMGGMGGMGGMGSSVPAFNQANLMAMANNLRTGNLLLDMCLMTFLSSLIAFFMRSITWNNFSMIIEKIWTTLCWCKELIWPSKPEPDFFHVNLPSDKKKNRVYINYEYKRNRSGDIEDTHNSYIIQNNRMFDALFNFLSHHPNNMNDGEISMKYKGTWNNNWKKFRSYELMVKPMNPVEIDEYTISFGEREIRPQTKPVVVANGNGDGNGGSGGDNGGGGGGNGGNGGGGGLQVVGGGTSTGISQVEYEITYHKQIIVESSESVSQIIEFIENIYKEYIDKHYPEPAPTEIVEEPRFFYVKDKGSGYPNMYKRYPLESRVRFEHIFFPEKNKLLRRIDQFMNKTIPLSKFTILLHGPPGGGKTSFIKALHNYTGCNVVVVKLSQYYNLKDLINTFHDSCVQMSDGNVWKIPINKRIYLFEDIDAEDKIVLKRDQNRQVKIQQQRQIEEQNRQNQKNAIRKKKRMRKKKRQLEMKRDRMQIDLDRLNRKRNKTTGDDEDSDDLDKTEDLMAKIADLEYEIDGYDTDSDNDLSSDDDEFGFSGKNGGKHGGGGKKGKKGGKSKAEQIAEEDLADFWGEFGYKSSHYNWSNYNPSIKLADILNLLDGVLELSGCFVVMSTNHVEKLDPALIRPGRVTYNIHLSTIQVNEMKQMIGKFVPDYRQDFVRPEVLKQLLRYFRERLSKEQQSRCPLDLTSENGDTSGNTSDNDENEAFSVETIFETLLKEVEDRQIMPCLFETFCQNEDKLLEVMINMIEYLTTASEQSQSDCGNGVGNGTGTGNIPIAPPLPLPRHGGGDMNHGLF